MMDRSCTFVSIFVAPIKMGYRFFFHLSNIFSSVGYGKFLAEGHERHGQFLFDGRV